MTPDMLEALGDARDGDCKGAFVWWELSEVAVRRAKLEALMDQSGLDPEVFMPPEIMASAAFTKSCKDCQSVREGLWMRRLNKSDRIVCVIKRETQDMVAEDVDWNTEAKVTFSKSSERVTVEGTCEAADAIADTYEAYKETHIAEDIRKTLIRNIADFLGGFSLRRRGGGIYFVLPQFLPFLYAHRQVVRSIGSSFYVAPIHTGGDVGECARDGLEDVLRGLERQVEEFRSDPPRADTLKRRLEEFAALKAKLGMYSSVLGMKSDDLQQKADDLDAIVAVILNDMEQEKGQ
jgi:hypothetical protein